MSGTIEIADAKVEDAVILTDISKRAFETDVDVGAPEKGGPPGYDSVEEHRAHAATDRFDFLKVLYDGKIIGGIRIFNSRPGEYDISGLFIDPEYHRKGIGSRMFDLLKEKYSDGKKWALETPEWNIRTKNFYEKLGFEQVGILRWEIGLELRFYELLLD
ncbi:MAG: GNAT family N-acetyltransferase, partial [Candidatus Bathyarchaeota archaeon]